MQVNYNNLILNLPQVVKLVRSKHSNNKIINLIPGISSSTRSQPSLLNLVRIPYKLLAIVLVLHCSNLYNIYLLVHEHRGKKKYTVVYTYYR
eukprot:SAG11_NODE_244_length_11735_cov_13.768900_4_plen_92_part_00